MARGFRLSSESIRDHALAASGLLNRELGGPSIKPYQPPGLWKELAGGASQGPYVQDKSDDIYRRSMYIYRKRTVPPPMMTTFDAGSREICQVARARTNTPLQALALLNDPTYVESARRLAERSMANATTLDQQIAFAFQSVTSRPIKPRELKILRTSFDKFNQSFQSTPNQAKAFIEVGDSAANASLDTPQLAAMTMVCSMILNLDETITKQ